MVLQCDVEKQIAHLMHRDNRNEILNDILLKADSTKRDAMHGGFHSETRTYKCIF